jgi:hypothetical protein
MNGNVHHKFLPQAEIMNQHFCADVLHLQLNVLEICPEKWHTGDGLHHHDNAAIHFALPMQKFPANSATTVAPHPSTSHVSLPCFSFSKTQSGSEGKVIS